MSSGELPSKPAAECRWDLVSLGEVMLRFDPGEGRTHTTRSFRVWEGGGEYNVARSLRCCFGLRTSVATALADNPVGRLVEDLILQGGVDTSLIRWRAYDGVGPEVWNGFHFVERGFGPRLPLGCSDRGHTAISQVAPGAFDWASLFSAGVRCLHTGGVFAALSANSPAVAAEAIAAARTAGTLVSYDLNYRESLWKAFGGNVQAREVNSAPVWEADVLFAGANGFSLRLGVDTGELMCEGRSPAVQEMVLRRVAAAYPSLCAIAMTGRVEESAYTHRWGAVALVGGEFVSVEAIRALFPEIPLIPTGGVTLATAGQFLDAGAVALGVGSDLVDVCAIRRGPAELVTEMARAYLAILAAWKAQAAHVAANA